MSNAGGYFCLSKEFCKKHVSDTNKMPALNFRFKILDGKYISEPFTETPFCDINIPSLDFASGQHSSDVDTKHEIQDELVQPSNDSNNEIGRNEIVKRANLTEAFSNLYSQPIFSDFTLTVGGRSFKVHRNILSARSAVFRAMFEADMREKKESCSEVTDVDADTMDRMLRFFYSDAFRENDIDSAAKLFAAADKYRIETLKSKCVEFMVSNLSADNVCRVLSLADMHSEDTLMAKAKRFVFLNSAEIFRNENWERFTMENMKLASSIMQEKILSLV